MLATPCCSARRKARLTSRLSASDSKLTAFCRPELCVEPAGRVTNDTDYPTTSLRARKMRPYVVPMLLSISALPHCVSWCVFRGVPVIRRLSRLHSLCRSSSIEYAPRPAIAPWNLFAHRRAFSWRSARLSAPSSPTAASQAGGPTSAPSTAASQADGRGWFVGSAVFCEFLVSLLISCFVLSQVSI